MGIVFEPTFLSVGAVCTASANTWSVIASQMIAFLFGQAALPNWSTIINLGTTFCNLINFQK